MTLTKVTLRELTAEERQALEQLAASRTAQARLVERARIVLAVADGRRPGQSPATWASRGPPSTPGSAASTPGASPAWRTSPAPGRPPTYTAEQGAEVLAAALTDPKGLGLPFGCWTLDRLRAYLNEQKGIPIKRSRIDEILLAEGLRWRQQETWFGERVDPDFAEKRGRSSGSTPPRRRAASSSASTRWGRSRPRASPASSSSAPSPGRRPEGRTGPPGGPSRRSTTGGAARATSSGRSARPPARR